MPCLPFSRGKVALTCLWLLFPFAFGQKPAKLPLVGRKPFIVAWNAHLPLCSLKYDVTANLDHLFPLRGGYYQYPDCYNYNYNPPEGNYTGSCDRKKILLNDELLWLWNSSTAMFPSVYLRQSDASSMKNRLLSQHRLLESMRLSSLSSKEYDLPTYPYMRLAYRDARVFLTTKDLVYTIGESAALGAAGFIILGSNDLTSSRFKCTKVKSFLSQRLGQYITNVTRATEVCSDFLCQSNGRCVRRNAHAQHYLHLSADSYRIQPAGDGNLVVHGRHEQHELQLLAERFRCHCYEGHEGEKCGEVAAEVEEEEVEEVEEEEVEEVKEEDPIVSGDLPEK